MGARVKTYSNSIRTHSLQFQTVTAAAKAAVTRRAAAARLGTSSSYRGDNKGGQWLATAQRRIADARTASNPSLMQVYAGDRPLAQPNLLAANANAIAMPPVLHKVMPFDITPFVSITPVAAAPPAALTVPSAVPSSSDTLSPSRPPASLTAPPAPVAAAPATDLSAAAVPQLQPLRQPTVIEAAPQYVTADNMMADWRNSWVGAAANSPCGSCTGRACTMCSIRTGGPAAGGGQPTGYAPRTLMLYDPAQSLAEPIAPTTDTTAARTNMGEIPLLAATNLANAIVLENQKQGTPESVWMIGRGDPSIEGYAAQFTLNHGQRVDFKINTNSTNYRIDIYRLGYYGGNGARLVQTINRQLTTAQSQPLPLFNPTTKLVDAGNWSVSASWDIPADAVSGVYYAKMTRLDGTGGENMMTFIVRDDEAPSDITFQTSDTTWQAYNWWGGYNFYGGVDAPGRAGRASAVSYNRPIITRDGGFAAGPQDFIFGAEHSAIRFLEQNGYDVNYISGIDTAANGAQLLNSKIFLSVGHDEYWSADQRANVEAARDSGVNLSFWSGNEVYWETRWEASIDGSGTPYKTLVSYKERWDNANTDVNGTTSTWRDPVLGSGRPENALTGTIFTVDSYRLDAITVPYDMSKLRFWSNTSVANLQAGQVYTLTKNLLGYEWDSDLDNGFRPAGLVPLSSTTLNVNTLLLDYGSAVGPGTSSHALTLYRAPSGALVFGAGTVYWSWGLDSHHDLEATPTDPNVQQAMVNLFAEMGVQPTTLMQSLAVASQSTDTLAPTSTITGPGGALTAAQTYTITGTATDAGGGRVAVVEVSTNGGSTWHRATGFNNWTYSWTPLVGGSYNIRSRAVDDSINLEAPGAGMTVVVDQGGSGTLFAPSDLPAVPYDSDFTPLTVGVRFTAAQPGTIIGVRYYKGLGNTGTHVGSLWTASGTLLASASFTNETASGWQTVLFNAPVSVAAGVTYVASYFGNYGYSVTANDFATPHVRGPLTATSGTFTYAGQNSFPTTNNTNNYWVDVVYSGVATPNDPPNGVNDTGFMVQRNGSITIAAAALLANDTDPNHDPLTLIGAGAASGGTVTLNAQAQTITFTPTIGYVGAAAFGYSISDGRGGTGSAMVSLQVVPTLTNSSLFAPTDTPAVLASSDTNAVNLGVRFSASTTGQVTAIRYYKSANDTGSHTGSLWTTTGTLLASGTFTNETASGWQTLTFTTPVTIAAGTTYVASYHSNGRYALTANYFTANRVSGQLTAPAAGNGVFTYGANNAMPTSTYNASNYWVDVVFTSTSAPVNQVPIAANDSGYTTPFNTALTLNASALLANDSDPDGDPLTITGVSAATNGTVAFNAQAGTVVFTPTAGYAGAASFVYAIADGRGGTAQGNVGLTVSASANRPPTASNDSGYSTASGTALQIAAASLLANDSDPDGDPLTIAGVSAATNGSVAFNAQTNIITFTPTANYNGAASFSYAVADGRGGSATAAVSLSVVTQPTGSTLFAANATPATTTVIDNKSVELGMRFTVASSGTISGMRFYKGPQNVGTHTGTLWSPTGVALGTVTFANETASGWQSANFSNPVAVQAGTNYVVSYHTTTGFYSVTPNYFTSAISNGGITAPQSQVNAGNGLFAYGASVQMPTGTYNATNYWVDVYYQPTANQPPTANGDTGLTTQRDTVLQITAASLLANDTDPNGDALLITGVSAPSNGSVVFNAQANTVTFTPTAGYTGAAGFTYAISDGRGGISSANVALNVTAPVTSVSLFAPTSTPTTVSVSDRPVELGMKFTSTQAGTITGIRFYKGPQNTGTHTGTLWSATGTALGTLTFQNETASGWQTANFATPIAVAANTTYVVSYHSNGSYSASANGFAAAVSNGPLTAPSSASSGGNGVYGYGSTTVFPTNSFNATNYHVDVIFNGQVA